MVKKEPPPKILSPNLQERRRILLLRGMLVVAVGGLLVHAGADALGFGALALVVVFAASDVVLAYLPPRLISSLKFELMVRTCIS